MNHEQQFYYALGFCTVILVLAALYKLFPPKDIHSLYGYKSKRALKTVESWKEANRFAGVAFFKISFIGFIFPFLFYFFIPQYNLVLTIITSFMLIYFIVFLTEKYLDTYFTKDGTRK